MAVNEVAIPPLLNTALYVGDLDPGVTTADLLHVFSGVSKVKLAIAKDSLCYARVEFETYQDAARAMSSLNHVALKGKAMRIMWYERNPITRKNGAANLFVKNLDPSIDSARLQAVFEKFGTVVSCKVSEENGKSKGFGFVQFEKMDSAKAAACAMNDTMLDGKKLYVSQFLRKSQMIAARDLKFTNLYVKNLDEDLNEDSLLNKFSEIGTVQNAVIMRDSEGKSKGFGFVSFKSPEEARKAVEVLNGAPLGSKNLFVRRAQKKDERKELRKKATAANVYVKNLDPDVDDNMLEGHFSSCGQVVSKKVMCYDNGVSKGFGFVSFSSPAEAMRAVQTLCGSTLMGRKIYVGIAQSKEDRQRALQQLLAGKMTASTPWFTSYPAANSVSRVHISQPKLFAEQVQVELGGRDPPIRKNVTENELLRLLTSPPSGLPDELVEKLLVTKGAKFIPGDYGATTSLC
ncbi:hypothetical protein Dimus_004245 [Dionaea muscipula]